jgi:maleate cis-trans isomerase
VYNVRSRLGAVIPANNSVLEPEFWSRLPDAHALYATRLLAKGDLTPQAVHEMEAGVDAAVEQLEATGIDVLIYADMVTTFVLSADWNERKTAELSERIGVPCISAWTALRDALAATGAKRIALGTPYPSAIHALAPPFFEGRGFEVVSDATLAITAMRDVPKVTPDRLAQFVGGLGADDAEAVVLLATDLPTFASLEPLEHALGRPVLSSNQTLLWSALRTVGYRAPIPGLARLGAL